MQRRFHNTVTDEWSEATFSGSALEIDAASHLADVVASHPTWDAADMEAVDLEEVPPGATVVAQFVPPPPPNPDQDTIDAVLDKTSGDVTAADVKRALLADLRQRHRTRA